MHIKAYYAITEYNPEYDNENQVIISNSNVSFHWYEDGPRYDVDAVSFTDVLSVELLPISKIPTASKRGYNQGKHLVAAVSGARDVGHGNKYIQFYIDMNIVTKEGILGFESISWDNIPEIIDILKSHNIDVKDPANLYDLFKNTTDQLLLMRHFESHYQKWAKELDLENPRKNDLEYTRKVYTYWQKKKKKK